MRLGLVAGYSGAGMSLPIDLILEAERLGFDSVWTAEAYGSDAVSPLAYIAAKTSKIRLGTAIMQMPARTPAMTAMTAMTLDSLSGGRFILGLGPSGPQVVEGWHGVAYGKPLTKVREYVLVLRKILAREAPVEFAGEEYQLPYRGEGATGLGKPTSYACTIQWLEAASKPESRVQVGDEVVTSGLGASFPPGLVVGKVSSVAKDDGMFQRVEVEPAVDVSRVRAVEVLLAPPPPPDPDAKKKRKSEPAFGGRPL